MQLDSYVHLGAASMLVIIFGWFTVVRAIDFFTGENPAESLTDSFVARSLNKSRGGSFSQPPTAAMLVKPLAE